MKLYTGRIPQAPAPLMDDINRSLPVDIRLWPYDIETNRAWARCLKDVGVYQQHELEQVENALDELADMPMPDSKDCPQDEDIHTLIERLLTEKLGAIGAKIHTGRSRNDQVVCDLRLYARHALGQLISQVLETIEQLATLAGKHKQTLLAGTTHLQPALPISLGQFFLSAAFALLRDAQRLEDALNRTNYCPLGSGAMAGSGFPVDRNALAEDLGFAGAMHNSIDAVSDRDFCAEIASSCALLGVHLSRYADQMIVWANPNFGYMSFANEWSTGSSMMPQKRNPDAMELVRGKSARMIGFANQLLCMQKGVPLTYAKDLQEDKLGLFDVLDTASLVVQVFGHAVASATYSVENMAGSLRWEMLATDLADALARTSVPFRKAHERVAQFVTFLEQKNQCLTDCGPETMKEWFPEFGEALPDLTYQNSLKQRDVLGGVAPHRIDEQLKTLKMFLAGLRT